MKVIEKAGEFTFDYKLTGLMYINIDNVLMLDRENGEVVHSSLTELEAKLSKKLFSAIESQLLLTNYWTNKKYEIVGVD